MSGFPRLASVVLPVYNQASAIGATLEDYARAVGELPFPCELLVIVNGKRRDNSSEICREVAARHACVKAFQIDEGGWGRAVRYGLSVASGDLLCYTNSARTSGNDLADMLRFGAAHPDAVIKASRKIRESLKRRFGSLVYNLECRALFDLPYWDVNGTPKVFPRGLSRLMELQRDDDLIDLEFLAICRAENYRVVEAPIVHAQPRADRSTTTMSSAVRMYRGAFEVRRQLAQAKKGSK